MTTNMKENDTLGLLELQDQEGMDMAALLAIVLSHKWLILSLLLAGMALGAVKAYRAVPIYKTDATLQIDKQRRSALDIVNPGPRFMQLAPPVLSDLAIIQSRKILGQVVQRLNLEIVARPLYYPVIGAAIARHYQQRFPNQVSEALFNRPEYAWGGEAIQVESLRLPKAWAGKHLTLVAGEHGHFRLLDGTVQLLSGEVGRRIKGQGHAQGIELFVSLLKARPGTRFVLWRRSKTSAIAQLQNTFKIREDGYGSGILRATLELDDPVLAVKALDEIANTYVRHNVEQKSAEAQKTLAFLEKQLPLLKDQLEAATTALNEYRTRQGSIDLDAETQGILKSVVAKKTQIGLLEQKREELRQKFTAQHPVLIALNKQLKHLKKGLHSLERQIEKLPETQQVIVKLSRDVAVTNELYTTLLNNAQTLRVAKAGTVGDVRVIDYAVLPTAPIKPDKSKIILVHSVLGLFAGIALAFIRKILHKGIEDPDVIEKQLGIPVYATIPHSALQARLGKQAKKRQPADNPPQLLAMQQKEDSAVESLRSLRTTLHFAFLESRNNIIMISGPSPGVGKTFVSLNLAIVLADTGKKILLIDADLRKGTFHQHLGVAREHGLSDIISGTIEPDQGIRLIQNTNVAFITTGTLPPNPSELLIHENFAALLDQLAPRYDIVIIDSPPILAVTDAAIIGRLAGTSLMVIKAGQHPIRELEQCIKKLTRTGANIKGIVFNDIPEPSLRYGYGYGYGYGYKRYVYQYNYRKS